MDGNVEGNVRVHHDRRRQRQSLTSIISVIVDGIVVYRGIGCVWSCFQ